MLRRHLEVERQRVPDIVLHLLPGRARGDAAPYIRDVRRPIVFGPLDHDDVLHAETPFRRANRPGAECLTRCPAQDPYSHNPGPVAREPSPGHVAGPPERSGGPAAVRDAGWATRP